MQEWQKLFGDDDFVDLLYIKIVAQGRNQDFTVMDLKMYVKFL